MNQHNLRSWVLKNRSLFQIAAVYVLPVVILSLAFHRSLENGLVWDDIIAFEYSSLYQSANHLLNIFLQPLVFSHSYYRPVVSITFALQNSIFGVNPWGMHLYSLTLHIVNTLLLITILFRLADKWYANSRPVIPVLLVGLFYGLHPVLIEPVSYISCRFDLTVTFFILLTMTATLSSINTLGKSLMVFILFLLAALSKEMSFGFALALPFWLVATSKTRSENVLEDLKFLRTPGNLAILVSVAFAGIVYLALRFTALDGTGITQNIYSGEPVQAKLILVIRSLYEYLALMVMPFGRISPAHPIQLPISIHDLPNLLAIIFFLLLVSLAIFLYKTSKRNFYLLVATVLTLTPVLNIVPLAKPKDLYFFETYLALPLVMYSLFLFSLFESFRNSRLIHRNSTRVVGFGVIAIWFIASLLTISATVPLWKNDLTLWYWVSTRKPELNRPRVNLAIALFNEQKYDTALSLIKPVLQKDKKDSLAWSTRGRIMEKLNKKGPSLEAFYKAVQLQPGNVDALTDLSGALIYFNEPKSAKDILLHVEQMTQTSWRANYQLGFLYLNEKDYPNAARYLRASLAFAPEGKLKTKIRESIKGIEKLY